MRASRRGDGRARPARRGRGTPDGAAPGHAVELAAEAASDADALVVFSGDGTYNEAINGAAGDGSVRVPARAAGRASSRARSGFPATRRRRRAGGAGARRGPDALDRPRPGQRATVLLRGGHRLRRRGGAADRRARPRPGRAARRKRDLRRHRLPDPPETRFRIPAQLEVEGYGRAAFVFVANGQPYTYAGRDARDDLGGRGLRRRARLRRSARGLARDAPGLAVRGFRGTLAGDPRVITGHDVDGFVVRCDRPLPLQADGEDLGDVTEATFAAERGCRWTSSSRRPRSTSPSARG